MNLNTLQAFRHGLYQSFERAADALFNTADALLTETMAQSFAELSLSPCFERGWPSLYEAFEDGRIARRRLQEVCVASLPQPCLGQRMVWGIDSTTIARPESTTSADRTAIYVHNLPECESPPVTAGWQFSTLMVLPQEPSSWGYVLDTCRIQSSQTPGEVAAAQLAAIVVLLPQGVRPLLLGDRYYLSIRFLQATAQIACDKLLRCKSNRVFYRVAPPPTGKRGAPRKDGDRFQCSDPATHGDPSGHWEGEDASGHRVEVDCWDHLHVRKAREIDLTLIRVTRFGASGKKRDPRVSWFVYTGAQPIPLADVWSLYKCRFGMEHTYRFGKQALLWTDPRLRTPEQFERWSQIVATVQNQLVLARLIVSAVRQPWERTQRPVTPQQVRRGMAKILTTLGTPARPPQPRGKSPGRRLHAVVTPAPRYPVVKKSDPKPKKRRKRA